MNNHSDGIYLYGSHNMLTNNVCENSVRGLYLSGSHNTSMNNIFKNNSTGMHISLSDNSVVSANVFENNKTGVRFSASSNNMFVNNIYNRNERGIEFVGNSHYNVFTNNIIENSSSHGIYIKPSEKLDNVYTISSYYNLFYLNRFSNNSLHAFDGASNYWDNGSVGNYWDDYTGTDTDGDGIGETPYLIADGKNQDNYPLVGIWNSSPKMSLPSGSVFQTKTPTLSWSQIIDISPPVTYELQVDNDSDFSSPEISVQVLSTSYTTSPLPNGTYYSRVRAVNSAGETSAWSSSLLFTISVPSSPLSLLAMIIVAIAFAVVLVATIRKRITAKVKVFQRVQFEAAINCG
jgi:parallel beta-helix repeat protein